jgi:uncharacterized Zn-binding protein involved in type VI secretion
MHAGSALLTSPSPRVRVAGQPAATIAGIWSVAGCPFIVAGAPVPCVTGQFLTPALRVKIGGVPAVLQDSTAVCIPNGTGMIISVTQTRVRGS